MRYDYYCAANDTVVEVDHSMAESLSTWGEVCAKAGVSPGETDVSTPVERLISGGVLALKRRVSKEPCKSDYDPVLHGNDSCIPCACAATDPSVKSCR